MNCPAQRTLSGPSPTGGKQKGIPATSTRLPPAGRYSAANELPHTLNAPTEVAVAAEMPVLSRWPEMSTGSHRRATAGRTSVSVKVSPPSNARSTSRYGSRPERGGAQLLVERPVVLEVAAQQRVRGDRFGAAVRTVRGTGGRTGETGGRAGRPVPPAGRLPFRPHARLPVQRFRPEGDAHGRAVRPHGVGRPVE